MRKAEFELRKIEFEKRKAQFEKKKAAFEKKKAAFEKKELEKNKGRKGKESQPPVFKVKVPEPPVLDESVREFHVTEVGWKGKTYRDFLNRTTIITEPPVTLRMSMAEVEAIAVDPSKLGLEEIPSHTQCVERMIPCWRALRAGDEQHPVLTAMHEPVQVERRLAPPIKQPLTRRYSV